MEEQIADKKEFIRELEEELADIDKTLANRSRYQMIKRVILSMSLFFILVSVFTGSLLHVQRVKCFGDMPETAPPRLVRLRIVIFHIGSCHNALFLPLTEYTRLPLPG